MFGVWTTINGGNIETVEPKPADMSYDRMKSIEENTGYNFTDSEKAIALGNDLANEASKTGTAINDVMSNVGAGIQNGAKVIKYLPFLALIGAGYYIFRKAQHG